MRAKKPGNQPVLKMRGFLRLEPVLDRLRSSIARMQADADEKLKPPSPRIFN